MAGHRVLIVEDEPLIAEGLEDLLAEDGHEICGRAISASTAVQLALTQRPDVILMDVKLVGPVDGVGAAETIRNDYRCGIVFLTAYSNEEIRRRIRQKIPEALILGKPADAEEITSAVRQAALA